MDERTIELLAAMREGDTSAGDRLYELLYEPLKALAVAHFRGQRGDHTLQPTALVHEVFVRLAEQSGMHWESRAHFLAVAAKAMRHILVDHARAKQRIKRGGGALRVTLSDTPAEEGAPEPELLDVEAALERLAEFDARHSRLVELRFYGGLTVDEAAAVLGVSKTTAEADWRMARAWLRRELTPG